MAYICLQGAAIAHITFYQTPVNTRGDILIRRAYIRCWLGDCYSIMSEDQRRNVLVVQSPYRLRMDKDAIYSWRSLCGCTAIVAFLEDEKYYCGHYGQGQIETEALRELMSKAKWAYVMYNVSNELIDRTDEKFTYQPYGNITYPHKIPSDPPFSPGLKMDAFLNDNGVSITNMEGVYVDYALSVSVKASSRQ